ncbi:hypothetical protein HMPREF0554_1725 [Pseudoleptotrichia goodfellowii F0264]|uniref:Uncharacterized protein n=1 Tax=Pseudoleptotrichia goodfellowii F0264 TaxID=596323 RepID=D0GM14_9FUSO|nr:hypothetical protein HMPREF0554_1725 [Pseudoleptotrichia goodfellowii F0264]
MILPLIDKIHILQCKNISVSVTKISFFCFHSSYAFLNATTLDKVKKVGYSIYRKTFKYIKKINKCLNIKIRKGDDLIDIS